jgi:hypothetical protein
VGKQPLMENETVELKKESVRTQTGSDFDRGHLEQAPGRDPVVRGVQRRCHRRYRRH